MSYNFGKDIVRKLYPEENLQPLQVPVQNPTIYLFSAQPSLADAALGTNAIQTVTSWTQNGIAPYAITYSFTSVSDPSTTGSTYGRTYYEALLYRNKAAAQVQQVIRTFDLERPEAPAEAPNATVTDLANVYPAITAYATTPQLTEHIGIALEEIKTELRAKGLDWAQLGNQARLKYALAYKTISLVCLSQIREREDKHEFRYKEFQLKYQAQMDSIALPFDENKDGIFDSVEQAQSMFVIGER